MTNTQNKDSIILIGMPGSGKSTLGQRLANALSLAYVDTDSLIESAAGCTLQSYLDQHDYLQLRELESSVILKTTFRRAIIATGGSVVYDKAAMHHLQSFGTVIFLDVDENELLTRIHNFGSRGIACHPDQSFHDLYNERRKLYQQYADLTVGSNNDTIEQSTQQLITQLASR
jgi:shikimate kinase